MRGKLGFLLFQLICLLIKTDLLSFLVREWERLLSDRAKDETCGLQFEDFELPTVLRVDSKLRNIISSLCDPGTAEGRRSFKNLKFCINMKSVAVPAGRQTGFVNIDNKDDWMSLQGG